MKKPNKWVILRTDNVSGEKFIVWEDDTQNSHIYKNKSRAKYDCDILNETYGKKYTYEIVPLI